MSVALTYNRNGATGGAVPVDSTAYTAGASATVMGNTGSLSFAGYNFAGWNTLANGSGTTYLPGALITLDANTTLYAIWSSATSLITPSILRAHMTSELTDAALQQLIDGEEQDIVQRFGPHTSQTEELASDVHGDTLYLSRRAASITSIVEEVGETETTLAATDYELSSEGFSIRRRDSGAHEAEAWGYRVTVVYVPFVETAKRILALINLCKLQAEFSGLKSESVGGGEYSMTRGDLAQEREQILASLGVNRRLYA